MVKKTWVYTSTTPCDFVAYCLDEHRNIFTFLYRTGVSRLGKPRSDVSIKNGRTIPVRSTYCKQHDKRCKRFCSSPVWRLCRAVGSPRVDSDGRTHNYRLFTESGTSKLSRTMAAQEGQRGLGRYTDFCVFYMFSYMRLAFSSTSRSYGLRSAFRLS
jgi:hypothetical protein